MMVKLQHQGIFKCNQIDEEASRLKSYQDKLKKQKTLSTMAKGSQRFLNCSQADGNCRHLLVIVHVLIFSLLTCNLYLVRSESCVKHTFDTNEFDIACVCNLTYCDKIVFDWPSENEILTVETNKFGARFITKVINYDQRLAAYSAVSITNNIATTYNNSSLVANETIANNIAKNNDTVESNTSSSLDLQEVPLTIRLYPDRKKQKIIGFGGAFTDAATYQLQTMAKKMRKFALEDYFGLNGLRYTLGRVPISGSDFSSRPYTYLDMRSTQSLKEDFNLTRFKLQPEDIALKIPIIRQAQFIVQDSTDYKQKLNLVGSSWSAPAWMKDNGNLVKGKLKGNSSLSYYDAYAKYHVKFLKEYKAHGIDFWGITSQNEPIMAKSDKIHFNSMIFEANELRDFIKDNLGPALSKNGFGKDKLNLLIYDDNTDFVEAYVKAMTNDTEAMKYVSGVAVHWYKRKSAGYAPLDNVRKMLANSTAFIISSEACNIHGTKPGRWESGVEYAQDIIETLKRHSVGWIDWNLVLDMNGGPNWSGNFVDAPILFDENKQVYYKNPMYYVLAHFTRFFEPNSQIIDSQVIVGQSSSSSSSVQQQQPTIKSIEADSGLKVIASERPNRSHYSIVILNNGSQDKLVNIFEGDKMLMEKFKIKSNSIVTVAIPNGVKIEENVELKH